LLIILYLRLIIKKIFRGVKMAFIRTATVGGRRYIQVADYYYDSNGNRRLKIIKSFGLETSQSLMDADAFLSTFQHFEKIKHEHPKSSWEELIKLALGIGGGVLALYMGGEILKWIFSKEK
jgi:hypothetical protein